MIGNTINRLHCGIHGIHFETSNILPAGMYVCCGKASTAGGPSECHCHLHRSNGFDCNEDDGGGNCRHSRDVGGCV